MSRLRHTAELLYGATEPARKAALDKMSPIEKIAMTEEIEKIFMEDVGVIVHSQPLGETHTPNTNDKTLAWKEQFKVNEAEISQIAEAEMIVPGLIAKGLLHAICSPGNGGKTTIMMHLAADIVNAGYVVTYVNADLSAIHAKEAWYQAHRGGFDLLLPDMKVGLSMKDIVIGLEYTASGNHDLSQEVWIFDTLKKMGDMINKSAIKRLYETLRKLTARGMTVICLGHTNKYPDAEGKLVYEGTADLRNDFDVLHYLIPKKNEDGSMTVSVRPDKERAPVYPMTFDISSDRKVTLRNDYVDVTAQREAEKQRQKDQNAIEIITEILLENMTIQSEIIDRCRVHSVGRRTAEAVLKRYVGKLWTTTVLFQNNAVRYELMTFDCPLV